MGKAERKLQRRREQNPDIIEEEQEEEDIMESVMELLRLVGPYLAIGLLVLAGIYFLGKLRTSKSSTEQRVATELRAETDPVKILELVDQNPDSPEAANQLMRSAKLSYNNGQFQKAMETYDRVVKNHGKYVMADQTRRRPLPSGGRCSGRCRRQESLPSVRGRRPGRAVRGESRVLYRRRRTPAAHWIVKSSRF